MKFKLSILVAVVFHLQPSFSHAQVSSRTYATRRENQPISGRERVVVVKSPSFAVTSNARYWITSRLRLEDPDNKVFIIASLLCRDALGNVIGGPLDDGAELHQSINMLRGETIALSPRMLLRATAQGPYTCEIGFVNGDPATEAPTTLDISEHSYIGIDGPQDPGSMMRREPNPEPEPGEGRGPSGFRLDIGQTADVAVENDFVIPDLGRPILFTGDVQWTVCRTSDDEVGCIGRSADYATIGFHLSVFQWNNAGTGYCSTWSAPFTYKRVDGRTTHHATTYSAGTFVPDPSCPARARVKIYVRNFGGQDGDGALAVHSRGTVLEAMPQ
jgi:hypothetical protein